MKHRGLKFLLAGASLVFIAGVANAKTSGGPKTAVRAANIIGIGGTATGTGTNGACEASGYDSVCPAGTCQCFNIPTAKVTGSIAGKATANVFVTVDPDLQTTDPGTTNGECTPFFGVAHVTSTSLTEDINLTGALCKHFTSNGDDYIEGGFGIADGASNSATGWGTLTGTGTHSPSNTPTVTLHLKGPITQ
jgi:hypothetical protein